MTKLQECIDRGLIVQVLTHESRRGPHDFLGVYTGKIISVNGNSLVFEKFPSYEYEKPLVEIPISSNMETGSLQSIMRFNPNGDRMYEKIKV